jgi:polyribonucleotide nucleotidyltransferase
MIHSVEVEIGGRTLKLETGKVAKQAGGAVWVSCGDSVVLVTATADPEPREGIDFFPLTVDYREYTYSAGRIPGGYIKREGRPTEKEILTSRLIDRPIRPLFPEGFTCETQVIAMVLSADPSFDPSVLGIVGASAALAISDIPSLHILGAVRVGLSNGGFVFNPTYEQRKESRLSLMVAAAVEGIVMVEAGAQELDEAQMVQAIDAGHQECKKIVAAIRELAARCGKPKRVVTPPALDQELLAQIDGQHREALRDALDTAKWTKQDSHDRVAALKKQILAGFADQEDKAREASKIFQILKERIFREEVLDRRRRPDARAFDQIRQITCEVGVLPRTHGSALFTRGETQALVTVTLGTKEDAQRQELLEAPESFKRFMLHYNFPPFSVGEVAFLRGPGRREVGHGALAERSLLSMIPDEENFPYTIRVVSDILESNGSSSMATVCGATLSMMDAGVPLRSPVAGIAMGLVKEGDKCAILTDIAGAEDHYGDMDFKVAGTREGVTGLQMDIKTPNVSVEILEQALAQARVARLSILDNMLQTIPEPRIKVSPYAPRIYTMNIPTTKIREVIGPGGKVIKGIIEQTGVKIDVADDGTIHIASADEASANKAMQMIGDITAVAEVGKTYLGKVVRLVDFGAFVEIFPGTDGLLHISEVAEHRIRDIRDELKEGDQILVKVLALEGNKIKLSRKAVLREQREKKKTAGEHHVPRHSHSSAD